MTAVLDILRELAAEHPARVTASTYTKPDLDGTPHPHCIVGCALVRLGVPVADLAYIDSNDWRDDDDEPLPRGAGAILQPDEYPDGTSEDQQHVLDRVAILDDLDDLFLLDIVQGEQDAGTPWRVAVATAIAELSAATTPCPEVKP